MSSICLAYFNTLLLLFPSPRTFDSHHLHNHIITIFSHLLYFTIPLLNMELSGSLEDYSLPYAELERFLKNNRESAYKCSFCDRSFTSSGSRNYHEKVIHLKQKPFNCRFCDKSFGRKSKKDQHEKTVHFKEKPFKCRFCNKKFGWYGGRNYHEQTVCGSAKSGQ